MLAIVIFYNINYNDEETLIDMSIIKVQVKVNVKVIVCFLSGLTRSYIVWEDKSDFLIDKSLQSLFLRNTYFLLTKFNITLRNLP